MNIWPNLEMRLGHARVYLTYRTNRVLFDLLLRDGTHCEEPLVSGIPVTGKLGKRFGACGPKAAFTMPVTIHNWDIGDLDENGYGETSTLPWIVSQRFHIPC